MEAPRYVVEFDERRSVLEIQAFGFWSRDLLERFGDELVGRMTALRAQGRAFTVLADATRFPVQSFGVSTGFMNIVNRLDRDLLVPTAIVAGGGLLRLQALRIFTASHIHVVQNRDAAYAWLANPSR